MPEHYSIIIEFKKTTTIGHNLTTDMYFNNSFVGTLNCTPMEYRKFIESLYNPTNPVKVIEDSVGKRVLCL